MTRGEGAAERNRVTPLFTTIRPGPTAMTEIERVWKRLKDRAVRHADSPTVPSIDEARTIVISICADECRERPPVDAIEYFSAEFMRLTIASHDRERTLG